MGSAAVHPMHSSRASRKVDVEPADAAVEAALEQSNDPVPEDRGDPEPGNPKDASEAAPEAAPAAAAKPVRRSFYGFRSGTDRGSSHGDDGEGDQSDPKLSRTRMSIFHSAADAKKRSLTDDDDVKSKGNSLLLAGSASIQMRQRKQMDTRSHVAQSAKSAREWLMPFVERDAPKYSLSKGQALAVSSVQLFPRHYCLLSRLSLRNPQCRVLLRAAMIFGTMLDFAIFSHLPIFCNDEWHQHVVRSGGPEQMRFLLSVAKFDEDGNGSLDDHEWAQYEMLSDSLINEAVTFSGNLAIVGALMLGLTHQLTIGRPGTYELSDDTETEWGRGVDWLAWLAYGFNCASEGFAFFTLAMAVITRSCVTNVLPSRESKIAMLRMTNALGYQSVAMMLALWCFILTVTLGTIVASPTMGFIGTAVWLVGRCTTKSHHTPHFT